MVVVLATRQVNLFTDDVGLMVEVSLSEDDGEDGV